MAVERQKMILGGLRAFKDLGVQPSVPPSPAKVTNMKPHLNLKNISTLSNSIRKLSMEVRNRWG